MDLGKQNKAKGQAGGGMQQPGLVEGALRLERDGLYGPFQTRSFWDSKQNQLFKEATAQQP